MSSEFTLESYGEILRSFSDRGYTAADFHIVDPAKRQLILRHDIDMSIAAALPMAEAEAALNMRAVYFVLVRTEFYNPWSEQGQAALQAIAGLGHEIGLHFDATIYGDDPDSLETAAAAECAVLEAIMETPVQTISFHRPVQSLQGLAGNLAGRRHAYEPRFFAEMGYCSDSRGGWFHGAPLDHPAVGEGRAIQVLTHPIWWTGGAVEPVERLDRFLEERKVILDHELARNCDIHRPRDRR